MFYYRKNRRLHHDSTKAIHSFLIMVYVLMLFFMFSGYTEAKILRYESEYVNHYCEGKVGVRNSDNTRTDCLTTDFSYEYDFAKKWYECISQGLYYGMLNSNNPACVLIVENDGQLYHVKRARKMIIHYGIDIRLLVVREY